jgi:hypothetical protein
MAKMNQWKISKAERAKRNAEIIRLRKLKVPYKVIMRNLNIQHALIYRIVKLHSESDMKRNQRNSGSIAQVIKIIGDDALHWIYKSKPIEMTLAEYVGVLIKDLYLEETDK